MNLYDYIYVDLDKVISLYRQLTGGVVEVIETKSETGTTSDNKRNYDFKVFKEQIDLMDEADIRDIRFEKHDYKSSQVRAFGESLAAEFPNEFDAIREKRKPITMGNLSAFRDKSEWLVNHTDLQDDPDSSAIVGRFVTAIDRLSVGIRAYC